MFLKLFFTTAIICQVSNAVKAFKIYEFKLEIKFSGLCSKSE